MIERWQPFARRFRFTRAKTIFGTRYATLERCTRGVDTLLEPGALVVTFANGAVARELIVTIDDDERRLVWAIVGSRFTHHNASAQVFKFGAPSCRFVWTADFLPDEIAADIAATMENSIRMIEKTLSRVEVADA